MEHEETRLGKFNLVGFRIRMVLREGEWGFVCTLPWTGTEWKSYRPVVRDPRSFWALVLGDQ